MREIVKLYVQTEEPQTLPNFLHRHRDHCYNFVDCIKDKFLNHTKEKLQEFVDHVILGFYMTHGDIDQIEKDIDKLIEYANKKHEN